MFQSVKTFSTEQRILLPRVDFDNVTAESKVSDVKLDINEKECFCFPIFAEIRRAWLSIKERIKRRNGRIRCQLCPTSDKLEALCEKRKGVPIAAFINLKSGSLEGMKFVEDLQKIPEVVQIYNLCSGGPTLLYDSSKPLDEQKCPEACINGLESLSSIPDLRVIVGGGDGSVSWLLLLLDALETKYAVAPLPLGTGNDLSRVLGWGTACANQNMEALTSRVASAKPVFLDRWRVTVEQGRHITGSSLLGWGSAGDDNDDVATAICKPTTVSKVFNNYFSIGFDAKVTLDFEQLRRQHPNLCRQRDFNKFLYFNLGLHGLFSSRKVASSIHLLVDGKAVRVPATTANLVVVNIPSYCNGLDLWTPRQPDSEAMKLAAIDDGLIEVVALDGPIHLALAHLKLRPAQRLAQGRRIEIRCGGLPAMCMQADGEAWLQQSPTHITIDHHTTVPMLSPMIDTIAKPVSL